MSMGERQAVAPTSKARPSKHVRDGPVAATECTAQVGQSAAALHVKNSRICRLSLVSAVQCPCSKEHRTAAVAAIAASAAGL